MSNAAHASAPAAQKKPPNNPSTPSANNVLTPRSHPTPSTGHPTQTNSPSAVRTAASPAHRAGLHSTHLAGKSPAQHTPTPGRHAATKSLLGATTATSSPSGGRPASSQIAAATMASAPSAGSNALHIPSNFGSPAGLGSLGLGSGLGMSMSLSGMGFSVSNTGASQLDEQERVRRLEHVVALLGHGHGRLSRENLERLGRRYGFEEVIGDYFLKNEDTTLYFAGGNHVVVEIECEDKMSSVVKKVGVTFSNLNDAVTEHQDAAGKVFKMDLMPPENSSNFNMSLDEFANNLERLSRLHQLSVPGANCFEAITGLFNSLRKLFEHDKKQRQKEDDLSDSRSAWKLDREITCKRCGRPRMHARRRYGLSFDYWMHGRMIPPVAEQHDPQKTDPAAEDAENVAALVIECDYTAPATVYPRIRVTDQWIAEQMRKPREEADNMSTASPEEGDIDWLDPDPPLIPAVQPSASGAGAASRSGQAKAHFVAKFEPPLMLPVGIATEIYAAVGLHLDLHDALSLADTILADGLPQETPVSVPLEVTRELRRIRDGEDETEEFRFRLFRQKQDLGSKLAQLPFQHPRQVIAILPILRQWALTAKLLQNTFTSKKISVLRATEATSNHENGSRPRTNGHTKPSRTIDAELADLLDDNTTETLTLDIELRVTNGLPQFTVTIPGPTWPRFVSFEVRPNADVVVGQQNLVDREAADFEKKIKGLTEALMVCEDIGIWVQWIQQRFP